MCGRLMYQITGSGGRAAHTITLHSHPADLANVSVSGPGLLGFEDAGPYILQEEQGITCELRRKQMWRRGLRTYVRLSLGSR